MIVLGSNEKRKKKKSVIVPERTNGHLARNRLTFLRVLTMTGRATVNRRTRARRRRQSLTISNTPGLAPCFIFREKERKKERERENPSRLLIFLTNKPLSGASIHTYFVSPKERETRQTK